MALRAEFIEAHIARWEETLTKPWYPYRDRWPSRLFHHAPIENAVRILLDGHLRSRRDPGNTKVKDVAAAGVIDARDHAHNFARLYFRPRTPTQYHIEGIRKQGECMYGDASHAPVLVMMVFDARKVLLIPTIKFCDRNMQLGTAELGDTEKYFSDIPFAKVYHEGGTGGDRTIIEHRHAEVLATSPMSLAETLQWVYCRTKAERVTLLYLLGPRADDWASKILVSEDLSLFDRRFVFLEDVQMLPSGLVFKLSPRPDLGDIQIHAQAWNADNQQVIDYKNAALKSQPPAPSRRWRIAEELPNGTYLVHIDLEGHLAFRGYVKLGDQLV